MFVHNVYFWLKDDLGEEGVAAFREGVQSLCKIPLVKSGHAGPPADTHRGVVDNSYSYGMVLVFDDKAGHDAYQVSDVHQKFVADHSYRWERVLVYDIEAV